MPQQNELRVFISSTFRDLQEEREHLIKKIFPEIRSLCRERGITFTEVDLRWGLTDEDKVQGQVLRTCLAEIDRCRPYFIGITGNRYGYVLEPHELYKDGELLGRHPWVEDAALEGASMIDMEFRHGALDADGSKGLFFFRHARDSDDDTEEGRKLAELKDRVRAAGLPIAEFSDPGQLGGMVFDGLIEIITSDFAHAQAPTPLEQERAKHQAFAASRREAYIPNREYVRALNEFAEARAPRSDDSSIEHGRETTVDNCLVIYAESGSGKSSLVSYWAQLYRRKNPTAHVIEHYVGVGATSTDHFAIMRHIMSEITQRMGRDDEIPSQSGELERAFANFLGFTLDTPFVIIIDGINQLAGHALELKWLPRQIPANIRLVITTTVEGTLVQLRERGWETLGMQPLSENEREAIIVRYLGDYHKALSSEQINRIASEIKCAHPLFLRTLLEELRIFGRHEELDRAIDRYLKTTGTEDLFQQVLERMEEDYSTHFVRDVMSLLWASRSGLTEAELADLLGVGRLKISSLTNGLDYHLARRNEGCLTFFHDYLRRAVAKRYMQEDETQHERYRQLADCFQTQIDGATKEETSFVALPRVARELVHALENTGDDLKLAEALSQIPVFLALWNESQSEVLELWQRLSEKNLEPTSHYRSTLDRLRASGSIVLPDALASVAMLLYQRSEYHAAIELFNELLVWSETHDDDTRRHSAHAGLGEVLHSQGDYDQSILHSTEALRIAESLGDKHQMTTALRSVGRVHHFQGRWAEAMACSRRALALAESLGNSVEMSRALADIGSTHLHLGDVPAALECFEQMLALAESVGDKSGMSSAQTCFANAHMVQGRHARAIVAQERAAVLAEALGNRKDALLITGNSGIGYSQLGQMRNALRALHRALDGHRELGFPVGQTYWLLGIAEVLVELVLAAQEYPLYLSEYLPKHTYDDWREVAFRIARQHAEECIRLSDHLSQPGTLNGARMVVARIDAAEGNLSVARRTLEELLVDGSYPQMVAEYHRELARIEIAEGNGAHARQRLEKVIAEETDQIFIANLHCMLWKSGFGSPNILEIDRTTALEIFAQIDPETVTMFERRIIAELNGEPLPEFE